MIGCAGRPSASRPPEDTSIIGTWRFVKAGEHTIRFPFLIEFRADGWCNSGPSPAALMQRSTYTFDGETIVITHADDQLVIPGVEINGKTMTMPSEDDGEPITLVYRRVWPP